MPGLANGLDELVSLQAQKRNRVSLGGLPAGNGFGT